MPPPTRRATIATAALAAAWLQTRPARSASSDEAPAPPMAELIRHPLLTQSLYRHPPSTEYTSDGAAGANLAGYRWIEEQRQGAEWIIRGQVEGRAEWTTLGWTQLDWGLARQNGDGGYDCDDAFHSSSLFMEALARALVLDPENANGARTTSLARMAVWMTRPEVDARGRAGNAPYTHRRYILAAAFGQAGHVLGDPRLMDRAERWAREGLDLRRTDGANPEKGGFDVGYQLVGVLMALRYLPVCLSGSLRAALRGMIRDAVALELRMQRQDGSFDPTDSTRIGHERNRAGQLKAVNVAEAIQALVFGLRTVPEPDWANPVRRIVARHGW